MRLRDLSFAAMPRDWQSALRIGHAWFPALTGSIESRWAQDHARSTLAAFALHVARDGEPRCNMQVLQSMIIDEHACPGSIATGLVVDDISEVANVGAFCMIRPKLLWGDPIATLALNVVEWRAGEVSRRWPIEWR